MFYLSCMVDDRDLAKVMHALDGSKVYDLQVKPAHNVEVRGGKAAEAGAPTTGPELIRLAIATASRNGQRDIRRKELMKLADDHGISHMAIGNALGKLAEAGELRAEGNGRYTVPGVKKRRAGK